MIEYTFDLTEEESDQFKLITLNSLNRNKNLPSGIFSVKYIEYTSFDLTDISQEYSLLTNQEMAYKFIKLYYLDRERTEIYKIDNRDVNFDLIFKLIAPLIRDYKINSIL